MLSLLLITSFSQLHWKTLVLSTPPHQSFLSNRGNKIRASSGEDKETEFLFQRISVHIQRFSSVLLHDSLTKDGPDQ